MASCFVLFERFSEVMRVTTDLILLSVVGR